jgi:FdhE protein
MRQGQALLNGKWTGNQHGGVKTPQALMLPDPATRFARTAARLDAFSAGHPMAEWLDFMARLARAQHAVAGMMGPVGSPSPIELEDAAEMTPPIAANDHRRAPIWRQGLALLLDGLDIGPAPAPVRLVMASLRDRGIDAQEALADDVLHGSVDTADVGAAVFATAALQVYFTRLAASLPASSLHLLPRRGLCPCCGSTPVCGVVSDSGPVRGSRYLHCSLCGTAWNHVRAVCITCGQSRSLALREIEGDSGAAKLETCDDCGTYAKMFYQAKDVGVDPIADDLATLGLDVLAGEEGWSRHAPNPFLMFSQRP